MFLTPYNGGMARIRIKHFGPIGEGLTEDEFIPLHKITVFIGPQGAGKSAVAKVISTFLWLEKAFSRGDYSPETFTTEEFKTCLSYHSLVPYLSADTELVYWGKAFHLAYTNGVFTCIASVSAPYRMPKISYIPAERNFCSAVPMSASLTGLLRSLFDLLSDFDASRLALGEKGFKLPFGSYEYRYDSKSRTSFIQDSQWNCVVELHQAASGIQSALPLLLVSDYFSKLTIGTFDNRRQTLSLNERDIIKQKYTELVATMGTGIVATLAGLVAQGGAAIGFSLIGLLSAFISAGLYKGTRDTELIPALSESDKVNLARIGDELFASITSCFVNIVEEPEQNLFPNAQRDVIHYLMERTNRSPENLLVITTHSPYVLETLNNCIYAGELMHKGIATDSIISCKQHVLFEDVGAYAIDDGKIRSIKDHEIQQIDANFLDACSVKINSDYEKLSNLEFQNS